MRASIESVYFASKFDILKGLCSPMVVATKKFTCISIAPLSTRVKRVKLRTHSYAANTLLNTSSSF